jgi:uncharacterized membrane-anchored protein YitT (DUF2179 family)
MAKQQVYRNIFEYLMIALGAFIMSLGIGVFLIDAHVVPGGVSGLSMAIYYLSDGALPVGLLMWIFNLPLFYWGIKEIGKQFGWRTFVGFSLNSLFIDLLRGEIPYFEGLAMQKNPAILYLLNQDFLFLVLWGAVLLGLGLGIIFKFKGTTAGSDIIAAILNRRLGLKPGNGIIVVDFFVIITAAFVIGFKDLSDQVPVVSLTMYAFFLLFISSRIIDLVIDGFDYARSVLIISDKNEAIGNAIMNKLSRGATVLNGRGLYRNIDREIVFTIVAPREVSFLYNIIHEIDAHAFVIVANVHEVMGEGFKRRGELSLPRGLNRNKS